MSHAHVLPIDAGVSVVIPCYNHGAFLDEAVVSAEQQSHPCVDVLVVDDGSTDAATLRTLDALRTRGVRVHTQANAGLAAARNAGVRLTCGAAYVPLDADDRLHPEFVTRLLAALRRAPDAAYAYPHTRLFGAVERVWRCPAFDANRMLFENLCAATALIRRDAFERVGGYQTDMNAGYEDWDFWLALRSAGLRGTCLPEPLFEYRQHPPGQSMLGRMNERRAEMLRRMIAHHRPAYAALLLPDRSPERVGPADDDAIVTEVAAAQRLEAILSAKSWRRLKSVGLAPTVDEPARVSRTRPSQRLARVERSIAFRLLRRLKSWAPLRRAALRAHGPQTVDPFAAAPSAASAAQPPPRPPQESHAPGAPRP